MFKKHLLFILLALSITGAHAQTVVYVGNAFSNNISVIDTATNTVTATIPTGLGPFSIVFSPDGSRAYVSNFASATLSVIDTANNTVVATVTLPNGSFPEWPAFTPDGKSLYVPTFFGGNVVVINTATNTATATIPVGTEVSAVVMTPDGSRAYALSDHKVSVIDTHTNTVVQSIAVNSTAGPVFKPIVITPGGENIYVAGLAEDDLQVIATASNTVVKTIPFSQQILGLAITPDGSRIYASIFPFSSLIVVDTASNTIEPGSIAVDGVDPRNVVVTPDGAFVYSANSESNNVTVISTATNTVVTTIPVNSSPVSVAVANLNVPFAAFKVDDLDITEHKVSMKGDLTLGVKSGGLDFAHQPVTLSIGNFNLTIPAGKIKQVGGQQHFVFHGTVNGLKVEFDIKAEHDCSASFDFSLQIVGVDVDTPKPATVTLKIGHNSGTTTAKFQGTGGR